MKPLIFESLNLQNCLSDIIKSIKDFKLLRAIHFLRDTFMLKQEIGPIILITGPVAEKTFHGSGAQQQPIAHLPLILFGTQLNQITRLETRTVPTCVFTMTLEQN
jgi:hypothetical protein